jgi:hypothetical protein
MVTARCTAHAQVVELADTPDSKSGPLGGAGSIPALGTRRAPPPPGAMFCAVRARLILLTVTGSALAAIIVLRRRAFAKHADEFHQRYG